MGNERLRRAMADARVSIDQVSQQADVDPKTVQRWLKGRTPYTRHRWVLASLLGEEERYLWPSPADSTGRGVTSSDEVVAAYAHRSDVPSTDWWELFAGSAEHVDLLGYAMLHLPEQNSGLMALLKDKGAAGCAVRVVLADPRCTYAADRDAEERLNKALLARIRTSHFYFSELHDCPGVEIRQQNAPMYNSVFRFDDQMYVTPHLYGIPGSKAPLFHLRRRGHDGVFADFAAHFEGIWAASEPAEPVA